MADKITESHYGQLNFGFADGDTRIAKIPNPITNVEAAQIAALSATLKTNQLIVGDKAGADFNEILTYDTYHVKKTEFDLRP